jgi:hypothetical protein
MATPGVAALQRGTLRGLHERHEMDPFTVALAVALMAIGVALMAAAIE